MMLDILNSIAATTKRTEKEEILSSLDESSAKLFKQIAVAAYDNTHDFWVKVYPRAEVHTGEITLSDAVSQCMSKLSTRQLTGGNALKFLTDLDSKLSADDAEVLNRVIERDLKCGATDSTFNKIWPDLIYSHPYMRCSSFNLKNIGKLNMPAFSQTKEDGQYVDVIVDDKGDVHYTSRTGKKFDFTTPDADAEFSKSRSTVFMGEVLVIDEKGDYLPRTEGNGYLNKDSSEIDPSRLVFVLWDIVPLEAFKAKRHSTEYVHRYSVLKNFISTSACSRIRLVSTRVVKTIDDIIAHMKEELERGKEGTVIKNFSMIWADGTSTDQVKCKIEFDVELRITGVVEGKNSNKGKLGAFECESEDGLVKVKVGGGFKAKDRIKLFDTSLINSIITARANDIVQDRNDLTVWSLFLPRYIKFRPDKNVADTYDRILEQKNAFIEILEAIK